ncbi:glycosyltransferase family 4 protein [Desulfovibrio sp. JC022]|uniref:glycosyltransferase family 4 protein n=1 Tax=Desulfovibrio sp. JC022 TaxID=2593642 RepID=UPI0013D0EE9F|nr:glycosyltransferase family 4 protein [Desulfovibrio sp. JC022]NDV24582.1 glycosyltransferase family 4 protein [Desulfovibrio sp. JC022]
MRILHLLSQIPDATGSGKYVQEMIRQSLHCGHSPYLVCGVPASFDLKDTPLAGMIAPEHCLFVRFEDRDLEFKVVGMSDVMPYPSTVCSHLDAEDISAYMEVFERVVGEAVDRFSPDLIHSNHLWMATAAARRAAPHIPLVATCHGTCLRQHNLCPELGRSLLDDLSGIDRVIALFGQQKREISTLLGLPEERVTTICGGFNSECFYADSCKPDQDTVHILYAGKLNRAKGVPWLLRCLAGLGDQKFHLHLVGGGSGPEKQECLDLASTLGKRVTVYGILSHQELGNLMRRSHIFVLPSFFEGVPLVLLEALACGCMIIATDLPGVKELFYGCPADVVRTVDLLPLQTIDRPRTEDWPELDKRLSVALEEAISAVHAGVCQHAEVVDELTGTYTWGNIFKRITAVYEQAVESRK